MVISYISGTHVSEHLLTLYVITLEVKVEEIP